MVLRRSCWSTAGRLINARCVEQITPTFQRAWSSCSWRTMCAETRLQVGPRVPLSEWHLVIDESHGPQCPPGELFFHFYSLQCWSAILPDRCSNWLEFSRRISRQYEYYKSMICPERPQVVHCIRFPCCTFEFKSMHPYLSDRQLRASGQANSIRHKICTSPHRTDTPNINAENNNNHHRPTLPLPSPRLVKQLGQNTEPLPAVTPTALSLRIYF